jgi:hypothetical protein
LLEPERSCEDVEAVLELDGKLESLVTIEEEGINELDSTVEEDEDDSGINDDIDGDDVDSLLIKLVLGIDGVEVDEGKGNTHPVKMNANNGIANPMNRDDFGLFIPFILVLMV